MVATPAETTARAVPTRAPLCLLHVTRKALESGGGGGGTGRDDGTRRSRPRLCASCTSHALPKPGEMPCLRCNARVDGTPQRGKELTGQGRLRASRHHQMKCEKRRSSKGKGHLRASRRHQVKCEWVFFFFIISFRCKRKKRTETHLRASQRPCSLLSGTARRWRPPASATPHTFRTEGHR